ncbi:MAG: hypothetical protein JO168_10985 [Solirubrobacterales bacterium]|nr:hypothetical protein [Solirubrobacterales bacterium]
MADQHRDRPAEEGSMVFGRQLRRPTRFRYQTGIFSTATAINHYNARLAPAGKS